MPVAAESAVSEMPNKTKILAPNIFACVELGMQVVGMTVLRGKLYVALCTSELFYVYDAGNMSFKGQMHVRDLQTPWGLASSDVDSCLYVSDHKVNAVLQIRLESPRVPVRWNVGRFPTGLSVRPTGNVLVVCWSGSPNTIEEYASSGQLKRRVPLDPVIRHPHVAVQLDDGNFVVSHGIKTDPIHRVSIVDAKGQPINGHGNRAGLGLDQLNGPTFLAVDCNGFVFVADFGNNRIIVLKPPTLSPRQLPLDSKLFHRPRTLCFDDARGRLFVGEFTGGRIFAIDNACGVRRTVSLDHDVSKEVVDEALPRSTSCSFGVGGTTAGYDM